MKTGIWLDKRNAFIVKIEQEVENLIVVKSEVDDFKVWGGSGTRFKGGPQDVVQDSKYMKKEKHQLKNYFNSIFDQIEETDELLIIGPAEVPQYFHKHIESSNKDLFDKIVAFKKEDSMTENQIKAYVRDFFINEMKI